MTIKAAALERGADVDDHPSTFAQELLFPKMTSNPDQNRAHNIENIHVVRGLLDVAALSHAIDHIIARHESLRTVFTVSPRGLRLRVLPAKSGSLIVRDHLASGSADPSEIDVAVRADAEHLFDLTSERPSLFTLHKTSELEYILVIVVHHLVVDGWSMGILLNELATAYAAARTGHDSTYSRKPAQMSTFARNQRELAASPEVAPYVDYWVAQLAGLQEGPTVPYDNLEDPERTFLGDRLDFELPGTLVQNLREIARLERVTIAAVALLGFQLLLRDHSGQDDISIGVPFANRTTPEVEDCVGFLINIHCVRVRLPARTPTRDLLHKSSRSLTGALRHQEVPLIVVYEDLVSRFGAASLPNRFYRTMYICHTHQVGPLHLQGTVCLRKPFSQQTSKTDITLNVWPDDSSIRCQIEYNTALYDSVTIDHLAECYRETMARIVDDLVW
ncbi:condensation domain-containing protein [Rhodococcus sp. NPDC060176]|uniref:condensation domain-containing protein n=1 Tax=Rhodococcus sp. NPDC060176 TaxID=3347062 RepID=UPI0036570585